MELALKSVWPAVDRSWKSLRAMCDYDGCHNTQLMRTIPGGRAGIQCGTRWYCSVDCFAGASRDVLGALSNAHASEPLRNPRMSLGLTLLSKGQLTLEAFKYAQVQSELHHENLDTTLIRLGLVDEKKLAAARAAQWGYPVLVQDRIGQRVEFDIPKVLLNEFSVVPLHCSDKAKRVVLGFVLRVEHSLLEAVEKMSGFRAEPCFITVSEFEEQMTCLATPPSYSEVVVEGPVSTDKMARTVGRLALEVCAKSAVFTNCKNHIWARLVGKRASADVIFRSEGAPAPGEFLNPLNYQQTVFDLA